MTSEVLWHLDRALGGAKHVSLDTVHPLGDSGPCVGRSLTDWRRVDHRVRVFMPSSPTTGHDVPKVRLDDGVDDADLLARAIKPVAEPRRGRSEHRLGDEREAKRAASAFRQPGAR